ncbi:hypothetical protein [Nocardia suismassiliense]|uniref:hypothetical protein n=1 Tax=Nocardia suismassiliense TaxID=2077092 RepID=UPI000D1FCE83|nr:hypothetical protein [Nocardia suismassiliense]
MNFRIQPGGSAKTATDVAVPWSSAIVSAPPARMYTPCDKCSSTDADVYMVHDDLWASSGLSGWVCFRCFEKAIGRRLVATDFKSLPGNTDLVYHGPELRDRLGLS